MPYILQVTREYVNKVDALEKANQERTKKEEVQEKKGNIFKSFGSNVF
jgi:hypothetical protein